MQHSVTSYLDTILMALLVAALHFLKSILIFIIQFLDGMWTLHFRSMSGSIKSFQQKAGHGICRI